MDTVDDIETLRGKKSMLWCTGKAPPEGVDAAFKWTYDSDGSMSKMITVSVLSYYVNALSLC